MSNDVKFFETPYNFFAVFLRVKSIKCRFNHDNNIQFLKFCFDFENEN